MDNTTKKKILCVLQLPPPVHGASMMNEYIINSSLLNKRFDLEFINLQFAKSVDDINNFSIRKIWLTFYYAAEILKKIIRDKPHMVYFPFSPLGFAFYRDFFYVLLMKISIKRIVLHFHVKGINERIKKNIVLKLLYRYIFKSTFVIYLTKSLSKDIREVYWREPYIVPNGIPWNTLNVSKKKRNSHNVPRILYLSNYKESKGILVLIEALDILRRRKEIFEARLVGAPSDLSVTELKEIIKEKKLEEYVTITGPKYNIEKTEEFLNADIFVFPTFYKKESFPLVILEAMQFSLPVVTTYEGGISDIVDDKETGFIVEKRNPEILAVRIGELLGNERLRTEMGEKGHIKFRNEYTLAHFENNMYETFNKILST